jgi:hypothetical protein
MRIQDKDYYYGAALTQIIEFPSYTAINKITSKNGLFQLNENIRFLIKYSTSDQSDWMFTFRKDDFKDLCDWDYYLVLVCSNETICLLCSDDISQLVDIDSDAAQWINVIHSTGGQHNVRGSCGSLDKMIPQNAFPKNMLGEVTKLNDESTWPELCQIRIYEEHQGIMLTTTDREFDLADNLMSFYAERVNYFGLSSLSTNKWGRWDESNIKKIEKLIKTDLEFDGYSVAINRMSETGGYCSNEFVWRLDIDSPIDDEDNDEYLLTDDDDIDDSSIEENHVPPKYRDISESFPKFVYAKDKSICSIEVDIDALNLIDEYKHGGWEELISKISADWVSDNSYSGNGSIWGWASPSVNFHYHTYSKFYAVIGMPKAFEDYLKDKISVLGKHVRKNSDYVVPNRREGWNVCCHIQDNKAWTVIDNACWQEVILNT